MGFIGSFPSRRFMISTQKVCGSLLMIITLCQTLNTLQECGPALMGIITVESGAAGPLRFTGRRTQSQVVSLTRKRLKDHLTVFPILRISPTSMQVTTGR